MPVRVLFGVMSMPGVGFQLSHADLTEEFRRLASAQQTHVTFHYLWRSHKDLQIGARERK